MDSGWRDETSRDAVVSFNFLVNELPSCPPTYRVSTKTRDTTINIPNRHECRFHKLPVFGSRKNTTSRLKIGGDLFPRNTLRVNFDVQYYHAHYFCCIF